MEALLKAGDILVCRGNSKLSKTIMSATKGEFSHTAQVISLNGILYIFDAQKGGCMARTFKEWKRKYNYDFEVFRSRREIPKYYSDHMMLYSGVEYDKKGLAVGLFKSLFLKLFKRKEMSEKYRNNGLFWCSELTMKFHVLNPEQYTPQKVYEWLIANNWIKVL